MKSRHLIYKPNSRARLLRCGNAIVEMALLLPVLIGLTFGAAEYGYAMYVKHTLQGASREGARASVVAGAVAADVQTAVDNSMSAAGFAQAKYTRPPTITPSGWATSAVGTAVSVQVSATWSTI